jgi:hypothetical protein
MKTTGNSPASRPASRLAAILLTAVTLICCRLAFGGELQDAAQSGDIEKSKALIKKNPALVSDQDNAGQKALTVESFKFIGPSTTLQQVLDKVGPSSEITTPMAAWYPYHLSDGTETDVFVFSNCIVSVIHRDAKGVEDTLYCRARYHPEVGEWILMVDTKTFTNRLQQLMPPKPGESGRELLIRYLDQQHIKLTNQPDVLFDEKTGELRIFAPTNELDKIARYIFPLKENGH